MDAVGMLDVSRARVNHSGSGSEQYPPSMRLGLLIYSCTTGAFSSRQIEQNTHGPVAVRLRVLRVGDGTPAVDGTQILANASKHSGSPTHRPAHFPLRLLGGEPRSRPGANATDRRAKLVANSTLCANRPSSRCLESSKKPWAFGASACAAWLMCAPNGRW